MSERAKRPLNRAATKAADDKIYADHAGDPRPNALYDADGNRQPLDANDPDQTDLRTEWMNNYKAAGGETEPGDNSGRPPDQPVLPCGQKAQVNPILLGDAIDLDESDVPEGEAQDSDSEDEATGDESAAAAEDDDSEPGPAADSAPPPEEPPSSPGELPSKSSYAVAAPSVDSGDDSPPEPDRDAIGADTGNDEP